MINSYASRMSAHTDAMWDRTWAEVKAQLAVGDRPPSFVLHLGDYVHGDCPSPEKSLQHYGDFVADMSRHKLPVPLMLTRGNHELQGKGVRQAYDKHMPELLRTVAPPSNGQAQYAFDVGPDARFLVLDVYQAREAAGLLGRDQLQWLDDELSAFRKRSPKGLVVIATHYPIFPMTPRGAVFDRDPKAHAGLVERLVDRHVITQVMTYTICPPGEQKGPEPRETVYRPEMIEDVDYRQPAHLESIREIVGALAPNVSGYRASSVPGYQMISVSEGEVRVTAYRGLGQKIYEIFDVPCG
jgi:hypothetical protein